MIQCNDCGFSVTDSMKHSLMSNSCPACGHELFSSRDMSIISTIQVGIESQPFAFNFTKEILYDISVYMFNEIKNGFGKEIMDNEALIAFEQQVGDINENSDDESDNFVNIRREVEIELKEEIDEIIEGQDGQDENISFDGKEQSDDIFSKAERLKRLAQQRKSNIGLPQERKKISAIKKTGATVRRSG